MIILDTNVLSEPLRKAPDGTVLAWLDAQPKASLFLTSINMGELLAGMEIMPEGKRKALLAEALHHMFTSMFSGRVLPFEENAARAFGSIIRKARASGTGIGLADAQIAAVALANGFSVATRDVSPFMASGVHVINPWLS